jgi:4-amino-4-deoxy-L-arabinose transferase-like glycosyltransferase
VGESWTPATRPRLPALPGANPRLQFGPVLDKTPDRGTRLALAILLVAIAVQMFAGSSTLPLLDNNEGLYATIAREMLASGDFVVPRIEGLPYLEKPPMLFWLAGLSFALFGEGAWVPRLVPEIAGALTCLALLAAGRAMGRTTAGLIAAGFLSSMIMFAALSRAVMFDIPNTLFMTCAALGLDRFLDTRDKRWLRGAYAAAVLAGLTKGLLGPALFALVILVHWIRLGARVAELKAMLDPVGIAIALAIFLPWHVALGVQSPSLLWHYLYDEHFLRYLDLREPHDYYTGPPWYYVPRLVAGTLPWTLLLAYPIFAHRQVAAPTERTRFAATWFWVIFAFFSLSHAKANYYMVLGMPALAWLFALEIDAGRIDRNHWTLALAPIGVVLCALAAAGVAGVWLPATYSPAVVPLALGVGILGCACLASTLVYTSERPLPAVAIATLGAAALVACALRAAAPFGDELSSARMGAYVRDHVPATTQVLLYADFERYSAFPFYARRKVGVLESHSNDLLAGIRLAGDPYWFPKREDLDSRITIEPPVILVGRQYRAEFRARYGRAWRCVGPTIGRLTLYRTSCH